MSGDPLFLSGSPLIFWLWSVPIGSVSKINLKLNSALRTCLKRIGSPLAPLKKRGTPVKSPLFKGDLGKSRVFCDLSFRTFHSNSFWCSNRYSESCYGGYSNFQRTNNGNPDKKNWIVSLSAIIQFFLYVYCVCLIFPLMR